MTIQALQFRHELVRYGLSRAVHALARPLWSARLAPLHHVRLPPPEPERADWVRLRVRLSGICGSDLLLLTGGDSLYLEPEATYPFVPGHEVVGDVERVGPAGRELPIDRGARVAVWPVLGCRARGLAPLCAPCRAGWDGLCERRGAQWPSHGLAIGFNRDTGGGWSDALLAHRSQLWPLPQEVTDEDAVLLDPAATALAALLRTQTADTERTLVVGGGTIGLLAMHLHAALRLPGACEALVRHRFQRDWAVRRGLTATVVPDRAAFREWAAERGMPARRVPGYGWVFHGHYDRVIDAAGTASSLAWSLAAVRPRGQVVLVTGPRSLAGVDATPIWYREVTCRGIYVYGPVPWDGGWQHPYAVLLPRINDGSLVLRDLVTHTFDLDAYPRAFAAALKRRASGAIKIAFRPAPPHAAASP